MIQWREIWKSLGERGGWLLPVKRKTLMDVCLFRISHCYSPHVIFPRESRYYSTKKKRKDNDDENDDDDDALMMMM